MWANLRKLHKTHVKEVYFLPPTWADTLITSKISVVFIITTYNQLHFLIQRAIQLEQEFI
jgi:hypothetical protein